MDRPFIKNLWYVAAWSRELGAAAPIARTVIEEPIALYRRSNGTVVAIEDRCPHRHAPLSMGRIEGDDLRCMYHGLKFNPHGVCQSVPGSAHIPAGANARVFPVVEQSSWIWVWMGDPAAADRSLVPHGYGLDNPEWVMRAGAFDYAADYQLLNDNLCDLSHLDFLHERTLGASSATRWSSDEPKIIALENGLQVERWFLDHPLRPDRSERADTFNSYQYLLPGIFLMKSTTYAAGTATAYGIGASRFEPLFERVEQQAVTAIANKRTRYLYATGLGTKYGLPERLDATFAGVNDAFIEDRRMIEGQQRIWDQTSEEQRKAFLPQDKAPTILRRMIAARLADESRRS